MAPTTMVSNTPKVPNEHTELLDKYHAKLPLCISEIRPRLFLGNLSSIVDSDTVRKHGIKAGISLMDGPLSAWFDDKFRKEIPSHLFLHCSDELDQDILKYMEPGCDFITRHLSTPGGVAVHCVLGVSRSATIVIAYLMRRFGWTVKYAIHEVKSRRKFINPNESFLEQLQVWEDVGYNIWEDDEKKIPKPQYKKVLEILERMKKGDCNCTCERCSKKSKDK